MNKPVGPYTPALRSGDLLFVSGQIGLRDGSLVAGGVEAEAAQALENLAHLLDVEGCSMVDVVKTTVFLTDMGDYAVVNDRYVAAFGEHRPARSAVAVAGLPVGALVEIDAIARIG